MALTRIAFAGLEAEVTTLGAELQSLVLEGNEYLWQGDARWWTGRSPILFPIVGSLHDDHDTCARGDISLPRHGLARRREFEVVSRDETSVTYELASGEDTLESYPFAFSLRVGYRLRADAEGRPVLEQHFEVSNPNDFPLPFVVGGHPAFNVPVRGEGSFDEHELRFARAWSYDAPSLDIPRGILDWDRRWQVVSHADALPLTHRTFDIDTIVFCEVPQRLVSLVNRSTGHGVELSFEGFDYLGVWSAAGDAPFVAIEPWCGCASGEDEHDGFERKRGMTLLEPGKTFARSFTIRPF